MKITTKQLKQLIKEELHAESFVSPVTKSHSGLEMDSVLSVVELLFDEAELEYTHPTKDTWGYKDGVPRKVTYRFDRKKPWLKTKRFLRNELGPRLEEEYGIRNYRVGKPLNDEIVWKLIPWGFEIKRATF